ncbi:MAG: 16S rRNA (guanine(966)-N(2))-methyltransferase RsmD [Candidatus Dasytiphilus stammeri]
MIKTIRKMRIIGGNLRSRQIIFTKVAATMLRPTSNRIRETLFNWLTFAFNIKTAHCLDCYAGTGALSIEALSHEAASATLLELKSTLVTQIKKNLIRLGVTNNTHVIHTDTLKWLSTYNNQKKFNLIFIDPPFINSSLINTTIYLLEVNNWLMDKSWIYIETHIKQKELFQIPLNWHFYRGGIAGKAYYSLYTRYY